MPQAPRNVYLIGDVHTSLLTELRVRRSLELIHAREGVVKVLAEQSPTDRRTRAAIDITNQDRGLVLTSIADFDFESLYTKISDSFREGQGANGGISPGKVLELQRDLERTGRSEKADEVAARLGRPLFPAQGKCSLGGLSGADWFCQKNDVVFGNPLERQWERNGFSVPYDTLVSKFRNTLKERTLEEWRGFANSSLKIIQKNAGVSEKSPPPAHFRLLFLLAAVMSCHPRRASEFLGDTFLTDLEEIWGKFGDSKRSGAQAGSVALPEEIQAAVEWAGRLDHGYFSAVLTTPERDAEMVQSVLNELQKLEQEGSLVVVVRTGAGKGSAIWAVCKRNKGSAMCGDTSTDLHAAMFVHRRSVNSMNTSHLETKFEDVQQDKCTTRSVRTRVSKLCSNSSAPILLGRSRPHPRHASASRGETISNLSMLRFRGTGSLLRRCLARGRSDGALEKVPDLHLSDVLVPPGVMK